MQRAVVSYEDFSGGEWGTIGARRAKPGMFSGVNVRVMQDGSIGPRPGFKELAVTGMPSGTPWGLCYRPIGSSELAAVVGSSVVLAAMATTPGFTAIGTLSGAPTQPVRFNEAARKLEAFNTYFAVLGQGVYQLGYIFGSPVLVGPETGSSVGTDVELYRDRLVAGSADQHIFFSDAADFSTWDALSYFEVGYDFPSARIVGHRDGLSIFTASPIAGGAAGIWRVTGTLGVSDVIRRASNALPIHQFGDVVLDGDTALYIPAARSAPVRWDGGIGDEQSLSHLEWFTFDAATFYAGAFAPKNRDVLFVADESSGTDRSRGLLRSNGVWTFLTPGIDLSSALSRFEADKFMVLTNDATPKIMVLDTEIQRPAFTSDTYSRPGDASDTPLDAHFTLPEHWDPEGREIRVRSVIVNATKYATGSGTDNNITVTVTALDRFGPTAAAASAAQSWSEAGSLATTAGVEFRYEPNFGDQGSGGGFQIAFTALKGVTIRDVQVILDVSETRAA